MDERLKRQKMKPTIEKVKSTMIKNAVVVGGCFVALAAWCAGKETSIEGVCPEKMQAIYDEVKTPYKYGMILVPPKGLRYGAPSKAWLNL